MSPLELEICLWYHSRTTDMPWIGSGAPIVDEEMDKLISMELLERGHYKDTKMNYRPTPKLHAFVELLCATPLPIQKWIDPRSP